MHTVKVNGEGVEEQQEKNLDANLENNKEKDKNDSKAYQEAEGKKAPIYKIKRQNTTLEKTEASNDRKRNWLQSNEKVLKKDVMLADDVK